MDNRNRYSGNQHDYRDRYARRGRQDEQFSSGSDDQYGETRTGQRWPETDRGFDREENFQREDFSRAGGGYRSDTSSLDDYDRFGGADQQRRSYNQGSGSGNYGGYNPSRNTTGFGSQGYRSDYGSQSFGSDSFRQGGRIPPRQYDRDERGFFDRASDEVMSWFGDDDAARRRQMDQREDHRGKGPVGYTRSKERLLEDANERLMRDSHLDASNITVTCEDNEITLTGTVASRSEKRHAEDIVEDISGVKHVQNNLRVESRDSYYGSGSQDSGKKSRNELKL